ncbi:MAG: DUF4282 domain-containing protein [Methylophilaceae bacterium]|nr:DUF4282 domain-containing protein [Methylophilaceae bacterium]
MQDIFYLETMLTPKVITFVYWLLLFFVLLAGLGTIFRGADFISFLTGLLIIVGGGVGARLWCELLIVLFKIHENIKKLAEADTGNM